MDERIVTLEKLTEDAQDASLRPERLSEYIGQEDIKDMLSISIQAAKKRNETLDHTLLYGPPGLGKTTLAQVIANEMGVNIKIISGPTIERTGDLAAILTSLEAGDVLFIDEIHRVPKIVEEVLYSSMEDFVIDIVLGKDSQAKSIRVDLPPFTLVGATTRYGDLTGPLRDRFGLVFKLDFYNVKELEKIALRTAKIYGNNICDEAAHELALRSRGTPRICNRLFRRIRDYADILNNGNVTIDITRMALGKLNIDCEGLDNKDRDYLMTVITKYKGGPVGVDNISAALSEDTQTIEDVYEPFLIKNGYVKRTTRGRVVTEKAYKHLKINYQGSIFDENR